jgi:hypothetical protein
MKQLHVTEQMEFWFSAKSILDIVVSSILNGYIAVSILRFLISLQWNFVINIIINIIIIMYRKCEYMYRTIQ